METNELEIAVTDASSNAPVNKYTVIGFAAGIVVVGSVVAVIKWRKSRSEPAVETTVEPETVAYVPGSNRKNA